MNEHADEIMSTHHDKTSDTRTEGPLEVLRTRLAPLKENVCSRGTPGVADTHSSYCLLAFPLKHIQDLEGRNNICLHVNVFPANPESQHSVTTMFTVWLGMSLLMWPGNLFTNEAVQQ